MGDSRATIKIQLEIYEKSFKTEMSINWYSENGGIDSRVSDWFIKCVNEADIDFHRKIMEKESERLKEEELAELKRLKDKYES